MTAEINAPMPARSFSTSSSRPLSSVSKSGKPRANEAANPIELGSRVLF